MKQQHQQLVKGTSANVDEYRLSSAINQSFLKDLVKGTVRENFTETKAMALGSLLDFYLTMDGAEFLNFAALFKGKQPSDKVCDLVTAFLTYLSKDGSEEIDSPDLEIYSTHLTEFLAERDDFYPNLSIQKRVEQFISKAGEWFTFRVESYGKLGVQESEAIINHNLATKAQETYPWIWGAPHSNSFGKHIQTRCQEPLFFTIDKEECKGLCDLVLEYETGVLEIDIKFTTVPTFDNWIKVAQDKNYAFQKAFYRKGLEAKYPGKEIQQLWLVIGSNFMKLVQVSPEIIQMGTLGYKTIARTFLIPELTSRYDSTINHPGILEAMIEYRLMKTYPSIQDYFEKKNSSNFISAHELNEKWLK